MAGFITATGKYIEVFNIGN